MQDVFGDVDDLLGMYAERRATNVLSRDDEEEEDEALEPADEEDPDAVAAFEELRASLHTLLSHRLLFKPLFHCMGYL